MGWPKHIKQLHIKQRSPEWEEWRNQNGFGGSEIASVVAMKSKTISNLVYTPPIKLHCLKLDEPIQPFTGNVESMSGIFFEKIILHTYYKNYDLDNPDQKLMFENIFNKKPAINKVIQPGVIMTNTKYPWLFYSPDSWLFKDKVGPKRLGECKNTTSFETKRYPNKISPSFYCQVQQGLMITELEKADLCLLIDGRWFEIVTVEPDQKWFDLIQEVSYQAWRNILEARKIKLEYEIPAYYGLPLDYFTEKQKQGVQRLMELEPELTGTEHEYEFIRDMVKAEEEEIEMKGTDEQMKLCIEYLKINGEAKEVEAKKRAVSERLLLTLGGSNLVRFDDQSFFSFKKDSRGSKRLYISPKIEQLYGDVSA